jgi:DNA helicase-2/ATP-dependent DNA helicase PcrA
VADRWAFQAVLTRTNAQLAVIEQALVAAGIPCRVRGGGSPLATPEVRDVLKELSRPATDLPSALAALDDSLVEDDEELSPAQQERRANVAVFVRLVHEYLAMDPDPSGPGLGAWLATLSASEVDSDADAVELTTFHGAKGLEWPVVHLAGLEAGLVPISHAGTGAQRAEERRLLYVALTRAERELHLSWCASRRFGANHRRRQPSPWLADLESELSRLTPGRGVDWRAQLARSRAAAGGAAATEPGDRLRMRREARSGADGAELEASLLRWRSVRARAARVAPEVILTDAAVAAIARARPRASQELAGLDGVGTLKTARFGVELLALLERHTG